MDNNILTIIISLLFGIITGWLLRDGLVKLTSPGTLFVNMTNAEDEFVKLELSADIKTVVMKDWVTFKVDVR